MEAMALIYAKYAREVLHCRPRRGFGLARRGTKLDILCGEGWELAALRSLGLMPVGLDIRARDRHLLGTGSHLPFGSSPFQEDLGLLKSLARVNSNGGSEAA
jgi:hypothetical protein